MNCNNKIDMVNHPSHYQSNGMEVIDVIKNFTAGLTGIEATDTGNVIKYICRWNNKNGVEDLEKAQWYLNHLIDHAKSKTNHTPSEATEKCKICCPKVMFDSWYQASSALCMLDLTLSEYGYVTVMDYMDLIALDYQPEGTKYGWTNLNEAHLLKTDFGWCINLPEPKLLNILKER